METREKRTPRKQPPKRRPASADQNRKPAIKQVKSAPTRKRTEPKPIESVKPVTPRKRTEPRPVEPVKPAVDVVYLPPKPFNRKRMLLRLATVVAVVVALLLGLSVFFKVDAAKFTVVGTNKYTAYDVLLASGIKDGDNLLTFSRARAAAKIRAELAYVDDIRIGIKLPDTVIIEVVEVEVPYAIAAQDGSWWLVSSSGKVIEKAADGAQSGYTRILGVQLDNPKRGTQASAIENIPAQTDPDGNTVPVTVTQSQRLRIALNIADYMELNGIFGKAATVDVNDLADIQIMYGQRYQVKLGNETQLSYKISCMKHAINKLDDYQSGVLDITFTTWPDKVGFTPFDDESVSILQIT